MFRPPFAYSTPAGCRDVPFVYTFDASNTPVLNQDINNSTIPYIQLALEQDAPFFWRGFKAGPLRVIIAGVTSSYALPNYSLMLWDCYENPLCDRPVAGPYVAVSKWGFPQNPVIVNGGYLTGPPTPMEEIYCPPGGVVQAFLQVPQLTAGGGQSYSTSLSLFGVKRYRECS
jgi:hypothetical protein